MPLQFGDDAIVVRGEQRIQLKVSAISADCTFAPADADVEEGDIFHCEKLSKKPLVVAKANKTNVPSGMAASHLGHTEITLITQKEWDRQNQPTPSGPTIHQTFHQANVVAGMLNGPVNVSITTFDFIQQIERQVEGNPDIPPEEKKSILTKLRDLAGNSYVANMATNMAWDATKAAWVWLSQFGQSP